MPPPHQLPMFACTGTHIPCRANDSQHSYMLVLWSTVVHWGGHASTATWGWLVGAVRVITFSQDFLSYFMGGNVADPCSIVNKSTGNLVNKSFGSRGCSFSRCLGSRLFSPHPSSPFCRTLNTCSNLDQAAHDTSNPPSITPYDLTHGFAPNAAVQTSTHTTVGFCSSFSPR
jgi:hypothetical protein